MLQLLRQCHLMHFKVCLLHAEKHLAFLQCPSKVGKLFGPRTRCARLGDKIPLDGIGMDTTSCHTPVPRRQSQRLYMCAQVVQITRIITM
jgi:hypothetical protein